MSYVLLWMVASGLSADVLWMVFTNRPQLRFTWCGVLGIMAGYIRGVSNTDVISYIRDYYK